LNGFTANLCPSKPQSKMNTNGRARKYAAEQGIAEEEALKKGMEAKSREFVEKGNELYAKV